MEEKLHRACQVLTRRFFSEDQIAAAALYDYAIAWIQREGVNSTSESQFDDTLALIAGHLENLLQYKLNSDSDRLMAVAKDKLARVRWKSHRPLPLR